MQLDFITVIIALVVSWILLFTVRYINKYIYIKNKKCKDNSSFYDYDIDSFIIDEVLSLIEAHFGIKKCYIDIEDSLKSFYDMSSFDLHENYEDFEETMKKKYNVDFTVDDRLIDVIRKITKNIGNTREKESGDNDNATSSPLSQIPLQ